MKSMYIGSGDIGSLMSALNSKTYAKLLQRFVSDEIPYYNAKASPIDALRTGAILEERYAVILPEGFYSQVRSTSKEMNVFKCSLDFAKLEAGKIVDFEELKTCSFNDFIDLEPFRQNPDDGVSFIKKKYKKYYQQIQQQLFCTELESAVMTFLVVYSYDDEENYTRDIQQNEFIKFRIKRDEDVIAQIKQRGQVFQLLKEYHSQK